ncbi:MAG TPA: hypothetical protein VNL92_02800 [Dehalococcoidia bacterium]|nr:hypothetical protein [Dehalococcoidia bacterium]
MRRRLSLVMTLTLLLVAALAAACGDDDDDDGDGDGDASGTPVIFAPPTLSSLDAVAVSTDQQNLWVDFTFDPSTGIPSLATCAATAADGSTYLAATFAELESDKARAVIPLGAAPDGDVSVRCEGGGDTSLAQQTTIARDPTKVKTGAEVRVYNVPDRVLDRNQPTYVQGERTQSFQFTWYRSGFEWTTGQGQPLHFSETEPGVFTAEADPFEELHQEFTVRFEGNDILLHGRAEWDNGRVEEYDDRWTFVSSATPTPTPEPRPG